MDEGSTAWHGMARKWRIDRRFDEFLDEDGRLEEATAVAIKRVIAWQCKQTMDVSVVPTTVMATRMQTNSVAANRLQNEDSTGLTIATLCKGARALGYRVEVKLVNARRRDTRGCISV